MTADPVDWRIERYGWMGFSHTESTLLAHTHADDGTPLYWGDVEKLLQKTNHNHAQVLDILLEGVTVSSLRYEEDDDGA